MHDVGSSLVQKDSWRKQSIPLQDVEKRKAAHHPTQQSKLYVSRYMAPGSSSTGSSSKIYKLTQAINHHAPGYTKNTERMRISAAQVYQELVKGALATLAHFCRQHSPGIKLEVRGKILAAR
jgi:hypothetical protein